MTNLPNICLMDTDLNLAGRNMDTDLNLAGRKVTMAAGYKDEH